MSNAVKINVGKNGISGLIAQADTTITLDSWFESDEERTFVVKFSDYCAYMSTFGREGYNNVQFSVAHKIMEMLTSNSLSVSNTEVNDVINACYCTMMRDIGVLLVKEACLFARNDSDWVAFNIEISLPVVLKKYFGVYDVIGFDNVSDSQKFVDITPESDFDKFVKSDALMNLLVCRDDISMYDIMMAKGTQLEKLIISGVIYLELCSKNIKGRVTGGI